MLTFIVPVRHPQNTENWPLLKARLAQTMAAIAQQDHPDWRAVVITNTGTDLPEPPTGVLIKYVEFPPNEFTQRERNDTEARYESIRYDKGRRILAGMLHARASDYFMVVDDDDFVSRKLARFVAAHRGAPGWRFDKGYVWSEYGSLIYRHPRFHKFCGTSHIVRADLMQLPAAFEDASDSYIKRRLGSHIFIDEDLRSQGTPLATLPFCGAVYRIGHTDATSRSQRLLKTFILRKDFVQRPWGLINALLRLRWVTARLRQEFSIG